MMIRKEILQQAERHNLALANMDGPMTVGRAGWINPFGFFILDRHFLPTHLPLTQPCKAETRTLRVNHTRARERGLCSARKDHAKDRTWSSDRGRDDSYQAIGLSVVLESVWRVRPPAKMVAPMPALQWARCRHYAEVGIQKRENRRVILTYEMIHSAKNGSGGWNKRQLAVLGVKWPPRKGWLIELCGEEISEREYARFCALRREPKLKKTSAGAIPLELPLKIESKYPLCAKCGVERVYAAGGPHQDWCEPCIWEFVKEQ